MRLTLFEFNTFVRNQNLNVMKLKIQSVLVALSASFLIFSCKTEEKKSFVELKLTNPKDVVLNNKEVSIKREVLKENEVEGKYPLLIIASDTIPSQLSDLDGDGEWDELFFMMDFSENEEVLIELSWTDNPPDYKVKTSIRFGKREAKDQPVKPASQEVLSASDMPKALGFQKYQTDGPTWENDKVAFRHYLDGRNAKDIFGKTTSEISPDEVGINDKGEVEDNYHTMEDWGRDIFPVGNSVGLGGFALLIDDEFKRLGITVDDTLSNIEETLFNIVDEGALKSIIKYDYKNWATEGNTYGAEEVTSIWAGMYGFKNQVKLNGLQGNETLLIGLSNINNENPLLEIKSGDFVALILHDKQTYEREWVLGTALLIPKKDYKGYIEAPKKGDVSNSFFAKVTTDNNQPITYYALAAGEMSPDENFDDPEFFKEYVKQMAKQLSADIEISIE